MKNVLKHIQSLPTSEQNDQRNVLSHELRTPLAIISGYAQMLEQEAAGELSHLTEPILRATERMTRVVDALLSFEEELKSTRMELPSQALDVSHATGVNVIELASASRVPTVHMVNRIVKTVSARHTDCNVDIVVDVAPDLSLPTSVSRALSKALDQTIDNAIKFTENGKVRIEARHVGEQLIIEVIDEGPGLPKGTLPLFAPLKQGSKGLDRSSEGLGMGLFLAKKSLTSISGTIKLRSNAPALGATAVLSIPHTTVSGALRKAA